MDGQWWIVNFDIGTGRRAAATALAAAGLLFALYPAVRPYSDETAASGAAAFASGAWVASHLFAMAGFILLVLGLLGLRAALSGTPGNVTADAALVVTWLGVGLTLPYYGAETFALNALGVRAVEAGDPAVLGLADPIRFGAAQATMFAAGLAGLAAGAVLAAVAIRRSGVLPRWSGVPLAAGMVLFLPQFFGSPALRIAHGVLVAVGCIAVAVVLWRRSTVVTSEPQSLRA
jgi:hypothetical protein